VPVGLRSTLLLHLGCLNKFLKMFLGFTQDFQVKASNQQNADRLPAASSSVTAIRFVRLLFTEACSHSCRGIGAGNSQDLLQGRHANWAILRLNRCERGMH